MRKSWTSIDLFAGAGGLSEGFRQAGFKVLAANDFDEDSANTFRLNHPDTVFLDGPIENILADDFLKITGLQQGDLDCLVGGPPCQAFSIYNHQRGFHDDRSGLFREYLRIVDGLMPKYIVMENVTGMTSLESGRAVEEIHNRLGDLGYTVEHCILKAEDYGVPQERRRLFFIGTRLPGASINWPQPTHGRDISAKPLHPCTTVADAISDLPPLQINQGEEVQNYPGQALSEYQRLMRDGSSAIYNHVAGNLSEINMERMKYIPPGGSWRDIPARLLPAGMKRAKRSDHTKRYGRLHPQGLACTILTRCDPHWGAFIHPEQDRALTVREAARFQSFPDRIRFTGSRVEQYRQVGNAVPPLLAKVVAEAVLTSLVTILEEQEEVA